MKAEMRDPGQEARLRLEAARKALNAQIAAYPPPIPACDAQFNHLLQQRSEIADALARLDAVLAAPGARGVDSGALQSFIAACPFLADADGRGRAR